MKTDEYLEFYYKMSGEIIAHITSLEYQTTMMIAKHFCSPHRDEPRAYAMARIDEVIFVLSENIRSFTTKLQLLDSILKTHYSPFFINHPEFVARQEREGSGVGLGDDERRAAAALITQNPLDVVGDAEPASAARAVGDFEPRDLDRVIERHELQKLRCNAARDVLESTVAEAVTHHVGGRRLPNRQRRRAPQVAAVLVTQVHDLRRCVAHWIVGPRGELILLRIDRPCGPGAVGGHEEAELRIGDDVGPRRRRPATLLEPF